MPEKSEDTNATKRSTTPVLKNVPINLYIIEKVKKMYCDSRRLTFLGIKDKIGYQMISRLNNFRKIPGLQFKTMRKKIHVTKQHFEIMKQIL